MSALPARKFARASLAVAALCGLPGRAAATSATDAIAPEPMAEKPCAEGLPPHAMEHLRDLSLPEKTRLTTEQMSALMHTYVEGERLSVVPFAGTGVATGVAGGLLLAGGNSVGKGAAWPLLTIGAAEVIAGIVFAARAGPNMAHLDELLAKDPHEFARVERAHVQRIRDRFQPVLLVFEAAVTAAGGTMGAVGAYKHSPTVEGVGLGIAVQGLALFLLDWAVWDRAKPYATAIDEFDPQPPPVDRPFY